MVLIAFLVFVLLCLLIASYVVYRICFHSPDATQNDPYNIPDTYQYQENRELMVSLISDMEKVPCEWVETRSDDGLRLVGRYYASTKAGMPTAICFHGYRGSDLRDFCGGYLIPRSRDWNTLVIEERGCSKSEGHTITFGVKEKLDLLRWIDYVNERNGKDAAIYLIGISMGGATVVMSTGLDLPQNVKAVIADSPYSSPYDIIHKVAVQDMKLPSFVVPLVCLASRLWGGFSLQTESAADAVKKTKVPVFIVHGEEDLFVPKEMSEEIQKANPKMVTRVTFPKAGHGLSYMVDTERYWHVLNAFLDSLQ